MRFEPSFLAAVVSGALALFVLVRDPRSALRRTFALGMAAIALRSALAAMVVRVQSPGSALGWQQLQLIATAAVPGLWLLFGVSYGRAEHRRFVERARPLILLALALPLLLSTVFRGALFTGVAWSAASTSWQFPLGWAGYATYILLTLASLLVLVNLEWTFRSSTGGMRWRLKFIVLGLAGYFGTAIFVFSQALLLSAVDTSLVPLEGWVLLVSDLLVLYSVLRAWRLTIDVYVAETPFYSSVTLLAVSAYLLAVGVLPVLLRQLHGSDSIPLRYLSLFLALVILSAVLFSDWLRQHGKRLLTRTFGRPAYDYRRVWMAFTQRTGSRVNARELAAMVARIVSETFGAGAVTLWLVDDRDTSIGFGASTLLSEKEGVEILARHPGSTALARALREKPAPVDVERDPATLPEALRGAGRGFLRDARARYVVGLAAGRSFLGLMTVGERLTKAAFSDEDFDLLKTFADQAAASLLHIRQSEWLVRAKEMEAFQSLSAFFVHDLKNLASTLSMTLQNLPRHYHEPAFRDDLLRVIERSVRKIDGMCSRLSPLSRQLELQRSPSDLNQVADQAVDGLDVALRERIRRESGALPPVTVDPEQMQKVLVNLLLNAGEASAGEASAAGGEGRAGGGEILLATAREDGWAVLSVTDDGCGMSEDFMARSLFQPFQTTKKQGLGIGLYHSRKIVAAHDGRIEVTSAPGRGSTFRVLLPLGTPAADETAGGR